MLKEAEVNTGTLNISFLGLLVGLPMPHEESSCWDAVAFLSVNSLQDI